MHHELEYAAWEGLPVRYSEAAGKAWVYGMNGWVDFDIYDAMAKAGMLTKAEYEACFGRLPPLLTVV